MTRRCCPLCTLRDAAVVSPDCGVCSGHGYLELGPATAAYDPVTVSTAVHLVLEQAARAFDLTHRRGDDPAPVLTAALGRCERNKLVVLPKAPAPVTEEPAGTAAPPPGTLAHRVTGATPTDTDQAMIRAAPYPYQRADRPGSRGLPLTSAGFHPSSLARVGDPQDFETTTTKQLLARDKMRFAARTLAYYVTTAEDDPAARSRRRSR